jgi:hypothetical protein
MRQGKGVNANESKVKGLAAPAAARPLAMLVAVSRFCRENNIPRVTFWRWEKRSWIKTIRIAGKSYLAWDELDRFMIRARNGEFAPLSKDQQQVGLQNQAGDGDVCGRH